MASRPDKPPPPAKPVLSDAGKLTGYNWPVPLCLVENEDCKLKINSATAKKLLDIRDPMVVVSIVGLFRTGKSHLMNTLAGKNGFSVGDTVQAKTKGIWIWCLPHPTRKNCCLALLDTEGLGDTDKASTDNDTSLFMLAAILSSVLVYNSVGVIDQTAMDKLQFVAEMADRIQVRPASADDGLEENDEIHEYCPVFIWVVRDFRLQLVQDGRQITSDEYLESALALKKGAGSQKHNAARLIFRRCFLQRRCFTFPPFQTSSANGATDAKLDAASADAFCKSVYTLGAAKTVAGNALEGSKFIKLASEYVTSLSTNKVTVVTNVVESVAQQVNDEAIHEAVSYYTDAMKKAIQMPVETKAYLDDIHKRCEEQARTVFFKRAMVIDNKKELTDKLAASIVARFKEIDKQDKDVSSRICKELIVDYTQDIQKKVEKGEYLTPGGYQVYEADVVFMAARYTKTPGKGRMAMPVMQAHRKEQTSVAQNIISSDKLMSEADVRTAEKQAEIQEMCEELDDMKIAKDAAEQEAEIQRQAVKTLEDRLAEHEDEIQKLRAQMFDLLEREQKRLEAERMRDEARRTEGLIKRLRRAFKNK